MDERTLLLLGLLKSQSQHGYQINEFIESNVCHVTTMKKPTAYALLERLERDGYVTVRSEQDGNRPTRKVYSITAQGEEVFYELLRTNLAEATPHVLTGDTGLMFLDQLPRNEVIMHLEQRLAKLRAQMADFVRPSYHDHQLGILLAVDHALMLQQADEQWLVATIEQLRHPATSTKEQEQIAHQ